jgi:hypothetical protein
VDDFCHKSCGTTFTNYMTARRTNCAVPSPREAVAKHTVGDDDDDDDDDDVDDDVDDGDDDDHDDDDDDDDDDDFHQLHDGPSHQLCCPLTTRGRGQAHGG